MSRDNNQGDGQEIPTRDKRLMYVDTTARWSVVDAHKFLEVFGTYTQAYAKMDDIINALLRIYASVNPLVELVRITNEMSTIEEVEGKVLLPSQEVTAPETVRLGREKITRAILAEASKAMPAFGMELVDVRIKRINYIDQVRKKVYERMVSKRKRKAAQFRSAREGKKAEILGQYLYFYAFCKTLETYKDAAYKNAFVILGTDSDYYLFLKTLPK